MAGMAEYAAKAAEGMVVGEARGAGSDTASHSYQVYQATLPIQDVGWVEGV